MRKKTGWSQPTLVRLVPTWSTAEEATCLDKEHTPQTAVKNSEYHSLTHDIIKWQPKRLGAGSGNCLWGIHVRRVVWRLAGSSQRLMVGWRPYRLGHVGWWVLCWVGCCWHSWLGGHGMVPLVCWSRIAGGHRLNLRLRIRGVNHGSSCGVGHDRAWA